MGCNCKKPKKNTSPSTGKHVLEVPGEGRFTFGSKLEADAENVRRGYKGRVLRVT